MFNYKNNTNMHLSSYVTEVGGGVLTTCGSLLISLSDYRTMTFVSLQ